MSNGPVGAPSGYACGTLVSANGRRAPSPPKTVCMARVERIDSVSPSVPRDSRQQSDGKRRPEGVGGEGLDRRRPQDRPTADGTVDEYAGGCE